MTASLAKVNETGSDAAVVVVFLRKGSTFSNPIFFSNGSSVVH